MNQNNRNFVTKIIAHRGYRPKNEPDNSLIAYKNAFDSASDGIELDIQLSSDGKFVCYHDDTLESIGISKRIRDLSFEDVIFSTLSDGTTIPSLDDVLDLYANKFLLNIELKTPKQGIEELIDKINQYELKKSPENLLISSFHPEQLLKIKKNDPEIPTGLLVSFSRNKVEKALKYRCNALHPFYNEIPKGTTRLPRFIVSRLQKYYTLNTFEQARKIGLLINPYTVNQKQYLQSCFENGVFSVITDEVKLAQKIRKKINSFIPSSN